MRFYSTKNRASFASLREAVLSGIPADGGLFMPEAIPVFDKGQLAAMPGWSLADFAFHVSEKFLAGDIPGHAIEAISREAVNFEAPLVALGGDTSILELFHGPTLAFKDFGARFLARLMRWLIRDDERKLTILVATSGDTGGAVAAGFQDLEGIEVIILYPSGKVSPLQEKQMTTPGKNIHALKIEGTFDDCQRLVKMAFSDADLALRLHMTSANSINIGRLIPQTFYYLYASTREEMKGSPPVFSVPSGNFGNLFAGLMAKRMGAPIAHFIAATNANDIVPKFLKGGRFEPKNAVSTISNAMDVGNPSNFQRLADLFNHKPSAMRAALSGYSFSDGETRFAMREVQERDGYVFDPHGAVAYLGWKAWAAVNPGKKGVVLGTAHPAKFTGLVESATQRPIPLPSSLRELEKKTGNFISLTTEFQTFKYFLLNTV